MDEEQKNCPYCHGTKNDPLPKLFECNNEDAVAFTYASKLPESQRFGKSTMILAQALNLLKYKDNIDMFKPLKFNPLLVEI